MVGGRLQLCFALMTVFWVREMQQEEKRLCCLREQLCTCSRHMDVGQVEKEENV